MVEKRSILYLIPVFLFLLINISLVNACVCGDGIIDDGEQCDNGALNGFLCWAKYGTFCEYCTVDCNIKIITNYCGDGIRNNFCEECDDGNLIDDDSCSNECKINIPDPCCGDGICNGEETCSTCEEDCGICPEPTCDHEIAIRYSYSNSYGTGIAIGYENNTWLENTPANLNENEIYKIKYFIDNQKDEDDNVHMIFKLDETVLIDEYKLINAYTSKEFNLDLNDLCGEHALSLEIESDGYECDLSDNYASREIYIECEEEPPEEYCGDGICNNDETCSTCPEDCGECEEDCSEYCYSCPLGECDLNEQCGDGIIQEGEECDDGNSNNFDGCSKMCFIEQEKEKTVKNNNFVKYCEPNWKCSGWGECVNGEMTRKCVDENRCSFSYDKPLESSSCYNEVLSRSYVEQRTTIWAWIVIQIIIFLVLIFILVKLLI